MAVFLTLGGLVFWVVVYFVCRGADWLKTRDEVVKMRYVHSADEYKEICDLMEEIEAYSKNHNGRIDYYEIRKAFPILSEHTVTYFRRESPLDFYKRAAVDAKLRRFQRKHRDKYTSCFQYSEKNSTFAPTYIHFVDGYKRSTHTRFKEQDEMMNRRVDEMRAKYKVYDPCD